MKYFVHYLILSFFVIIYSCEFMYSQNSNKFNSERNGSARMNKQNKTKLIIDCNYTFEKAISGIKFPSEIKNSLILLDVDYFSFDGKLHQGQLVINKELAEDIKEIFEQLRENHFPISKVIPIVKYNWDDEKSMLDNNTSAFNYRLIKGTKKLSNHAYGMAIDINPYLNPQITDNIAYPKGSSYNPEKKGTITRNSLIVKLFLEKGWTWGGNWNHTKDYQHFEKLVK